MRLTFIATLLLMLFLLCSNSSHAQVGDFNIEKVCIGQGKYAAVVEHNSQYYVVVSNEVILKSYQITDIFGSIQIGGDSSIRIFHNSNHQEIPVRIVDRMRWKYSGYPGARSICRDIALHGYGI